MRRIERRPFLAREDPRRRARVEGVAGQAVHRLGRDRDDLARDEPRRRVVEGVRREPPALRRERTQVDDPRGHFLPDTLRVGLAGFGAAFTVTAGFRAAFTAALTVAAGVSTILATGSTAARFEIGTTATTGAAP